MQFHVDGERNSFEFLQGFWYCCVGLQQVNCASGVWVGYALCGTNVNTHWVLGRAGSP
jgi:hypothetical protein